MPFYDDDKMSGHVSNDLRKAFGSDPSQNAYLTAYPDECVLLPKLICDSTNSRIAFCRAAVSEYAVRSPLPSDTNDTPLNRIINYPARAWSPTGYQLSQD